MPQRHASRRFWSVAATLSLLLTLTTLAFSPLVQAYANTGSTSPLSISPQNGRGLAGPLTGLRSHAPSIPISTACQTGTPCNPPVSWHNGPVMHHPKIYLIFWGNWSSNDNNYVQVVGLFQQVAHSANNNVLTQYHDSSDYVHTDATLAQTIIDSNDQYMGKPSDFSAISAINLADVADSVSYVRGLPTTSDSLFMVIPDGSAHYDPSLSPPTCGVRSYGSIGIPHLLPGNSTIIWAWVAHPSGSSCQGTAANAFHEYAEAATDPKGDGSGWVTASDNNGKFAEVGDLCTNASASLEDYSQQDINDSGGNPIPVQTLWDQAANTCTGIEIYQGDPDISSSVPTDTWGMPGVFTNVGIEQDGRLDVFILGSNTSQPDINIWHNVQTAPNSGWNGWYFLQYGSVFIGKPAVARNWDGRLEVFARSTDKNIWHIWQTAPGGPWSTWQKLQNGSSFNGDPAVVQNKDGRLEVFARGNDNNIWHIWQTRPADDTSWFTWQYMEKGSSFSGDPAVGMDTDGRVEVFAVGTDSTMWVNYQQSAGGSWSTWVPLPRSPATNGFIGTPAVARNADGHLEIFARKTDANIYHSWQSSPGSTTWAAWAMLQTGSSFNSDPSVGRNFNGRLEVFALGNDNNIWHIWQTRPADDTSWYTWQKLQAGLSFVGGPTVVMNADGHLEVFARGSGNLMLHNWQRSPGASLGWSGWQSLP